MPELKIFKKLHRFSGGIKSRPEERRTIEKFAFSRAEQKAAGKKIAKDNNIQLALGRTKFMLKSRPLLS